jgi:hypothetical protein
VPPEAARVPEGDDLREPILRPRVGTPDFGVREFSLDQQPARAEKHFAAHVVRFGDAD